MTASDVTSVHAPVDGTVWDRLSAMHFSDELPIAVGSRLEIETLIGAYRRGIFPWPAGDPETARVLAAKIERGRRAGHTLVIEPALHCCGVPIPWEAPLHRGVIPVGEVHIGKNLRRRLRTCGWWVTVDQAFSAVIQACAGRSGNDTWITPHMRAAYTELHRLGWAHSSEVWCDGQLIGGAYGVQIGGVFTGESAFRRESDASKVAVLNLLARLRAAGGTVFDTQVVGAPMVRLGARPQPGPEFFATLLRERDRDVRLDTEPRPVRAILEGLRPGRRDRTRA